MNKIFYFIFTSISLKKEKTFWCAFFSRACVPHTIFCNFSAHNVTGACTKKYHHHNRREREREKERIKLCTSMGMNDDDLRKMK